MKKDEKIRWLVENVPSLYDKAKVDAIKICDEQTAFFCYCGRLATGLHTLNCCKFQSKVKSLILKNIEIQSALQQVLKKNAKGVKK